MSNIFYALPFAGAARAIRDGHPLPGTPYFYSLAAVNATVWCAYGFVAQDPFFIASDLFGSIASTFYYQAVLVSGRGGAGPACIVFHTGLVAAVLLAAFYAQWGGPGAVGHTLGWAGNATSMAMLWAPIVDTVEAWQHRDPGRVLLPIAAMTAINSGIWTAYGIWLRLFYIWLPSLLTATSGVLQLCTWMALRRGPGPSQGSCAI